MNGSIKRALYSIKRALHSIKRASVKYRQIWIGRVTYQQLWMCHVSHMGWLRWVGSLKSQVSFTEYRLFYRALLQKKPIILRSLLIVATPYHRPTTRPTTHSHVTHTIDRGPSQQTCDVNHSYVLIDMWHNSFPYHTYHRCRGPSQQRDPHPQI